MHVSRTKARETVEEGGERTWMKAVAMMTPEPKYLAMKKTHDGTCTPGLLRAQTGKTAPARHHAGHVSFGSHHAGSWGGESWGGVGGPAW